MPYPIWQYDQRHDALFTKVDERWGAFSNMASGYKIRLADEQWLTSEALYQACRFPHHPDVQRTILSERSPMAAKMKSKPHRNTCTRPDWNEQRTNIMRWCLRLKLAQNWQLFSRMLIDSRDRQIIEVTNKRNTKPDDLFWGTRRLPADPDHQLEGHNTMGVLLMELREEILQESIKKTDTVEPPAIPDFLLLGNPVDAWTPR